MGAIFPSALPVNPLLSCKNDDATGLLLEIALEEFVEKKIFKKASPDI
jgi:hypothetical protein